MSKGRTYEHVLRRPSSKGEKGTGLRRLHTVRYERLMQVSIRHTFYNGSSNFKCPDFEICPTPSSAALMQSLGLLFKRETTGFAVLFNALRTESLTNYLREQARRDSGPLNAGPVWARLSFVLSLTNPYFVNFTDISIDTNPTDENFYFTNQFAHRKADGAIVINPEDPVNDFALDSIRVVPTQASVSMDEDVKEVHVVDISGEVVICRPRCVPKSLLKEKIAAAITCDEAADCTAGNQNCECTKTVYLDFSLLPEDKYTIELIPYEDKHQRNGQFSTRHCTRCRSVSSTCCSRGRQPRSLASILSKTSSRKRRPPSIRSTMKSGSTAARPSGTTTSCRGQASVTEIFLLRASRWSNSLVPAAYTCPTVRRLTGSFRRALSPCKRNQPSSCSCGTRSRRRMTM